VHARRPPPHRTSLDDSNATAATKRRGYDRDAFADVEQTVSARVLVMVDFFQQHRNDADVAERLAEVYARWHGNVARFAIRPAGRTGGASMPAAVGSASAALPADHDASAASSLHGGIALGRGELRAADDGMRRPDGD
jgi:hypothetical protein